MRELTTGPFPQERKVTGVRDLRKEDLARLAEPRHATTVKRLRDSHHHIARLFAAGLDMKQVAERTGKSYFSIRTLRKSPAFQQLLAEYQALATEAWAESVDSYFEIATANMVRAELQIADRLGEAEEAGETLPVRDLLAISRDAADRFGYGKRSTQVNVNADFAALLEKAIRRSGKSLDLVAPKALRAAPGAEGPTERATLAPLGDQQAGTIPNAVSPLGVRDSGGVGSAIAEQRGGFADQLADALGQASVAQGVLDPPPSAGVTAPHPPGAVTPFLRRRA